METIILNENQLDETVKILKNGGIVAIPTDTVYGLACVFNNEAAINSIKKAKNRPDHKPLPMMVNEKKLIKDYALLNEIEKKVIEQLMPGALTIVFKKKDTVKDFVTDGFDTIAIRIPADGVMAAVLKKIEVPLLVTSANLSGFEAVNTSDEVLEQLDGRIDAIIVGESEKREPSTIISLVEKLQIFRAGVITKEEIERVIGD